MAAHLTFTDQSQRFHLNGPLLSNHCKNLLLLLSLEERRVSIVFMGDTEIAGYNERYRQRRGPTNVLSFPSSEGDTAFPVPEGELGDILIAVDTAAREADDSGISLHHRLKELIIHGLLHLIGYDHERSERDAFEMWDKEKELMQLLQNNRSTTMPHLAINVDHVATVRQARGTLEPDPVHAASICELAGAEGIVVHLREDRRHIQDRDVQLLRKTVKTKLNLEMAISAEIIDIALEVKPDLVTLVPEKRKELTTEGGLNVAGNEKKVRKAIAKMTKAKVPVSLFIDPDAEQIQASLDVGATFVELHTGRYCDAVTREEADMEFRLIEQSAELAFETGLRVNAGHGLDYRNTPRVAALETIEELSIGHAIISRAVLVGLDQAVREMLELVRAPWLAR